MRDRIRDGEITSMLPSLTTLTEETGLAPNTIRRAIKILIGEGLVYTVPGRGTRLAQLRELASDGTRARIMETHAGITAAEFGALPLGTRRALVAACYTVKVLPASKRGPGFRTEDVELTPR